LKALAELLTICAGALTVGGFLNLEAIDKLNPNAQVIICTGSGKGNCPSFLPQPVTQSGG
jgi:hypothetical protein